MAFIVQAAIPQLIHLEARGQKTPDRPLNGQIFGWFFCAVNN